MSPYTKDPKQAVIFTFLLCQFFLDLCCCQSEERLWEPFKAKIVVHHRRRRSETFDFTQVNQNICPPSLCRQNDEHSGTTYERPRGTGGTVFYQGDIILDKRMGRYIYPDTDGNIRRKRATMRRRDRLWKKGEVVYRMTRNISPEAKRVFERAMNHIQKRTCITFREKKPEDRDFIRFISEPGCWSQIGRVGGVQMVSLGRGCESLGTAVHEIVHALGMWHEQARPDRNKHVVILEENISAKFKPDFEVVSKQVSTSRGYPYDYRSLMHYSKFAFTKNGRPTIKIKGIGDKLGLRIGQRQGLSTIDIAQLRDMYKCNERVDSEESVCRDGFKKIATNCYKVFAEEKAQFGPANSACQKLNSHLVVIETKSEQKRLTRYLNKKFENIRTFRTAGRRVNDRMIWHISDSEEVNITGYSNWAPRHPATYTSFILQKNQRTGQFLWVGEWAGSADQKPRYEHAYICEKNARRKCIQDDFEDGRNYRGNLDHTRDGYTCQKWTENYPHNHSLVEVSKRAGRSDSKEDRDGLGDHNKCRNPSGMRRNRPWCYTTKRREEWGYCDISICRGSKAEDTGTNGASQKRVRTYSGRKQSSSSSSTASFGAATSRATHTRRNISPSSSASTSAKPTRRNRPRGSVPPSVTSRRVGGSRKGSSGSSIAAASSRSNSRRSSAGSKKPKAERRRKKKGNNSKRRRKNNAQSDQNRRKYRRRQRKASRSTNKS